MIKNLVNIQNELKAPKSNFNSFGKYRYRSAEDILTAVKPLLAKYSCTMTITDEVVFIGGRFYIKATATITDEEGNTESVSAFAREDESKKGMDGSQITGTASSYSRKYCLNGMFLIDDTKDADTDAFTVQTQAKGPGPDDAVRKSAMSRLNKQIKRLGYGKEELVTISAHITGKSATKDMNVNEIVKLAEYLEGEGNA
jgi:hypothetical protein